LGLLLFGEDATHPLAHGLAHRLATLDLLAHQRPHRVLLFRCESEHLGHALDPDIDLGLRVGHHTAGPPRGLGQGLVS
jgi:hypothetical protein